MTTPYLSPPVFSWPAAPGGKLHTYLAGGNTPQATYSDAAGVTPNTNPVTLDSNGSAAGCPAGGGGYPRRPQERKDTQTRWGLRNIPNNFIFTGGRRGAG